MPYPPKSTVLAKAIYIHCVILCVYIQIVYNKHYPYMIHVSRCIYQDSIRGCMFYWLRACTYSVHNYTYILYSYCTCTICYIYIYIIYIYLYHTIANRGPKVLVACETHCHSTFTTHHSFKHARQPSGCIKSNTLISLYNHLIQRLMREVSLHINHLAGSCWLSTTLY